jgi:hypothetical protein
MVNKIQFGSNEAIIVDTIIKYKIIEYLYSQINVSKHRFVILNNINKLKFLQENEHSVSPNFRGYNYFLIMITIDNKKYCVAIDRKKLSYNINQIDMVNLNIIQINMRVPETFFQGTIFDGKLIQNNNNYVFLIQDCFYLMGNNLLDMEMKPKINYLDNIFKTYFNTNMNYCNNFSFRLNKLYEYSELSELIFNVLPTLKIPNNGITFFPKLSGINVIHIEKKMEKPVINNTIEKIDNKSYHIIYNFTDFLKNRSYSYENNEKTKQLYLTRTLIPDVYDLSEKENTTKIGIAHIPNLKISQYCNDIIKDKPLKFNCIMCNRFKKWIPIDVVN